MHIINYKGTEKHHTYTYWNYRLETHQLSQHQYWCETGYRYLLYVYIHKQINDTFDDIFPTDTISKDYVIFTLNLSIKV